MNALENHAALLADLGRFDEACAEAERVLAFFRGIGEPTDSRAGLIVTLGRCALERGHPQAARDHLQRALDEATRSAATPRDSPISNGRSPAPRGKPATRPAP
jgi:tetratricopeptide (TPR) repeat protein